MSQEESRFICTKQEIWEENKKALLELEKEVKREEERAVKLLEFERKKYKEFVEIAKGKDFFSLEHVSKLKLEWNILIILSEKNIGKTTEKYRIIRESIKNGKKILYGRATKSDLLQEVQILKGDKQAPVILKHSEECFVLYEKLDIPEDNRPRRYWEKPKEQGKAVGRGFYLKEANKLGGASDWSDYSYVLLDEVIPYDNRKTIVADYLGSWAAFMSSIVRNSNTDLKVVAFGNMLNKNNAFLEFYGINRDDKLRYICRGDNESCKILFLNVSNIYGKGFRNQGGVVQHAHPEFAINLKNNSILQNHLNIISPAIYEKLKPVKAFVLKENIDPSRIDDYYICEMREAVAFNNRTLTYNFQFFALKVFPLKSYFRIPNVKIFTDSFFVKNNFNNTTYIFNLNWYYDILRNNQIHNNLMFYDSESIRLIENLLIKTFKKNLI